MKKLVLCLLAAVCVFSAKAQDSVSVGVIAGSLYGNTTYNPGHFKSLLVTSSLQIKDQKNIYYSYGGAFGWFPAFMNLNGRNNELEVFALASVRNTSVNYAVFPFQPPAPGSRFEQNITTEQHTRSLGFNYLRHQHVTKKLSIVFGTGVTYVKMLKGQYKMSFISESQGGGSQKNEETIELPGGNSWGVLCSGGIRYNPVNNISIGISLQAGAFYVQYSGEHFHKFSNITNGQNSTTSEAKSTFTSKEFSASAVNPYIYLKYVIGK